MRTKAIATLRTMILWAVLLIVALNALPAVAADSVDCSPPICTSGVARPGSHLDVETRHLLVQRLDRTRRIWHERPIIAGSLESRPSRNSHSSCDSASARH
jgi:hypothetical protein